ncbi:MAG: D-alanyl-D-alanine carboxypeptidase/D-alanyl-D-alanine-endopeptidase [Planctomycetes bacterium]|nr:D-alanyl-D-alanine carboxypeptidase/D-alanyl-D-alanine-endopeptidase [Planctomycetota bacterium]
MWMHTLSRTMTADHPGRAQAPVGLLSRPGQRRWSWVTGMLGLALIVCLGTVARAADLASDIDRLISASELGSSRVAYSVVDIDSGTTLASRNDRLQMLPASNMKLLTSGAALLVLGQDFAFETTLHLSADGKTLFVTGSGDPALADPDLLQEMGLDVEDFINRWVSDVAAHPSADTIRTVLVDGRVFEAKRVHPSWELDDLDKAYGAEVCGFNFYRNILQVYAQPARQVGLAPEVFVMPDVTRIIPFRNNAQTADAGGAPAPAGVWISRTRGENEFTLYGHVKTPQRAEITVSNPGNLMAQVLADRLKRHGLTIESARLATAQDPKPEDGTTVIGTIVRTPLPTVLRRCNTDSENLYAEALLKRIGYAVTGQPGSWVNGGAIVRLVVSKKLGPALSTDVTISDGSGLSRDNRVTARLLSAWLREMYREESIRDVYVDSMAQAGETGTLSNRFRTVELDGRVAAKSGYLSGVSCLSGYVIEPNGTAASFSILVNNIPATGKNAISISTVKRFHERLVDLIDKQLSAEDRLAEVDESSVEQPTGRLGG